MTTIDFRTWLETSGELKVIDTSTLTSRDQYRFGNAAIVGDGTLIGYHVTDNAEKVVGILSSPKKVTATYSKGRGKYAELGPGLYVSAAPQLWTGRSTSKWDFLKNLDPKQKQVLANAIRNHPNLKGQMIGDKLYRYVTQNEEENANRWIDEWLKLGHYPTLTLVADQPYNIAFWKPEFLSKLGIQPAAQPKLMKVTFSGVFVDLRNNTGDWETIASCIRKGYDGGFNPGGVAWPELCIWKKECISDISEESNQGNT